MMDQIKFLRDAASQLRELAQRGPGIAEGLLRLADELEAKAAERRSATGFRAKEPQPLRPNRFVIHTGQTEPRCNQQKESSQRSVSM